MPASKKVAEVTAEETKKEAETEEKKAAPKKAVKKEKVSKKEKAAAPAPEEKKYAAPTNFSLDLIRSPIVPEKTMKLQNELNTIVVKVAPEANKTSIMIAFEQIFNVKPLSVRVVNVLPKDKRVGRYQGKVSGYKKAYVTLSKEDKEKLSAAQETK